MFFGFVKDESGWCEKTPTIFKGLPRCERRRLFLSQYNYCVEKEERITVVHNLRNQTLFQVFKKQILDNINNRPYNRLKACTQATRFDPLSATLIHLFKEERYDAIRSLISDITKMPKLSQAKLIYRLFCNEECGIVFDASLLFSQFVLEKITRRNRNKRVLIKDDLIVIESNDKCLLAVKLCFKEIDKQKIHLIKNEIDEAWKYASENKIPSLYLVFPKNNSFKRHIEIKNPCFANSIVKLVPYNI